MKTTTGLGRCALAACAALLVSWQVAAKGPAAPPKLPDIPTGWTRFENLAPVTVGGNTYAATCSAYPGTDPRFSFWARRGKVNNVVVYFEGGGGCWDNYTCSAANVVTLPPPAPPIQVAVPQLFVPMIPPTTNPAAFDGIFKAGDAANPVKDWSFVYIPYCTGDLHIGSATRTYNNLANPLLPFGQPFTIQHRGFDNFMVVLDWMRQNFRSPQTILVAGSSAGGYGAAGNFPYVKEAYPNAHLHVVADASQGVTTSGFDQTGRSSWNPQLAPWIYGADSSWARGADLLRYAAEHYPRVKVSQFTTALDTVQALFYGVMEQVNPPGGLCPSAMVDWNQSMLATLGQYAANVDNFRYYVAGGTYHTLLRSPTFYTESSGGIVFADWLTGMLKSQGGTGGSGGLPWSNRACPTCLTPVPCGP